MTIIRVTLQAKDLRELLWQRERLVKDALEGVLEGGGGWGWGG